MNRAPPGRRWVGRAVKCGSLAGARLSALRHRRHAPGTAAGVSDFYVNYRAR
jgi:hypothetical protein